MSKQFADISTRREYILWLTEVICQIFEITDPDRRSAITLELEWLDDEALIEKQGYLEGYFKKNEDLIRAHTFNITKIGNQYLEKKERENTHLIFNF